MRRLPFPIFAGHAVVVEGGLILLMGSADYPTFRVGKSKGGDFDKLWRGYGDRILCYDVEKNNYSHVGVMPYGVATSPWVSDGKKLYSFGGEPAHGFSKSDTRSASAR